MARGKLEKGNKGKAKGKGAKQWKANIYKCWHNIIYVYLVQYPKNCVKVWGGGGDFSETGGL